MHALIAALAKANARLVRSAKKTTHDGSIQTPALIVVHVHPYVRLKRLSLADNASPRKRPPF
jgi:hypothetical protein